ncbi:hypothetical protein EMIT0111MI5_50135 [Burkholderia sp. IT-111MI5]
MSKRGLAAVAGFAPVTGNRLRADAGSGRRQLFSPKTKKGVDSPTVDLHNSFLRRISSVG